MSRRTITLGAQEVFSAGLAKADAVLLALLATTVAVGQYGAAYRLMESTLFVPVALTSAFAVALLVYRMPVKLAVISTVYGAAYGLFPIAWIGLNSGVSRKRPDRTPFAAMNHPAFGPPTPRLASTEGVPKDPYCASTSPLGRVRPRPERVVALTTRLVLSPYSAFGVPVTISIFWIALTGT